METADVVSRPIAPPQNLDEWYERQREYSSWAAVATAFGVDRHTLHDWRSGARYPRAAVREEIHRRTDVQLYSLEVARERNAGRPKKRNPSSGTSAYSSQAYFVAEFNQWFNAQKDYLSQKELAAEIEKKMGITTDTRGTVKNIASGKAFPKNGLCDVLYEISSHQLRSFSPLGRDAARAEHRRLISDAVRSKRREEYHVKHPKHDRPDKGVARPERWKKANDAALIRSLLLNGEPIDFEAGTPVTGWMSRSIADVADDLYVETRRVHVWLRRIFGHHGLESNMAFGHGELLTNKWIQQFYPRFGFDNPRQCAIRLGLEPRNFWALASHVKERALTAGYGARLLRGEAQFVAHLMLDRGRKTNHFKRIVPDLREKIAAAKQGIETFRNFTQLSPIEQNKILNGLCLKPSKDPAARTILCWLPVLLNWLEKNKSTMDGVKAKEMAVDFVARDYGVPISVVQRAAYLADIQATAPGEIRALLLQLLVTATLVVRKENRRKKTFSKLLIENGRFCNQIIKEARGLKRLCVDGGRSIAEIQTKNPQFAIWAFREALEQEDKELFNHPRRWGPVVGYFDRLLGNHYEKKPATIKEWRKAASRQDRA